MKKTQIFLITLFIACSAYSGKSEKYYKNVWSSISYDNTMNDPLFFPMNDKIIGVNFKNSELDKAVLDDQLDLVKFNFWQVLRTNVLLNKIKPYLAYDPEWIKTRDEGFCRYQIDSEKFGFKPNASILDDAKLYEFVKAHGLFGHYDYEQQPFPLASKVNPGLDSVDANNNLVYESRKHVWMKDKDITKYIIREQHFYGEDKKLIRKEIVAIAPASKKGFEGNGELFWVKFEDILPWLENYQTRHPLKKGKTISFSRYFEDNLFKSVLLKEDEGFSPIE